MTQEEIRLIEIVLGLPPNEALMARFNFKDRAELVSFICAVAGLTFKLDEAGQLPPTASLDELAVRVKDLLDMLRPMVQPPDDPSSPPQSDPDLN